MKKKLLILLCSLFLVFCFLGAANATTITAEAFGSDPVALVNYPNTITNGDFTISGNSIATLVGNGVDERTEWGFDYNSDGSLGQFMAESSTNVMISALLTMTLTPYNRLITTDSVGVVGLSSIAAPIQSLQVGQQQTVTIELLDYYNSADLYSSLSSSPDGIISMLYQDDAILTYASLELTNDAAPVPEPATMFLLSAGLLCIAGVRRIKK